MNDGLYFLKISFVSIIADNFVLYLTLAKTNFVKNNWEFVHINPKENSYIKVAEFW